MTSALFLARRWLLTGRVQGVGFRPYVYRLARQYHLTGWVRNLAGTVEIHAQGNPEQLQCFADDLLRHAPPLSQARIASCEPAALESCAQFDIRVSQKQTHAEIHVPPDYFVCPDCLREMRDPQDRRYRYPFINCTQCGPRYTLIERLPYDRPNTSMARFPLCPECEKEYNNPLDRRFHAQPLACPVCGPQLSFVSPHKIVASQQNHDFALCAAVDALKQGLIVAVKGIGGYHLLCDAQQHVAIQRLRRRKPRLAKPLAVLFPEQGEDGLTQIHTYLHCDDVEAAWLRDPSRPIVLLRERGGKKRLSPLIAPGLNEVGAMLPYSPLHHWLLDEFGAPLVATSANVSGEPVLIEAESVQQRLPWVDAYLHHNRPILRPADDSVFRQIQRRMRPVRLGRGHTPLELQLRYPIAQPTLAVGGHLKNTIAIAWDKRLVVSPHIGVLDSPRSVDTFTQTIDTLQRLYQVDIQAVIHDAHPDYQSTRWAKQSGFPSYSVLHHHAHASALAGEYAPDQTWLMFVWDGVGYGEKRQLWGGEVFHGHVGQWRRVGHCRPFTLPGGDKVGREPWRSAAALCWEVGDHWLPPLAKSDWVYEAWTRRLNCAESTSVGRLFDAAAALLGLVYVSNYEAQGAMLLESLASDSDAPGPILPISWDQAGTCVFDWSVLIPFLQDNSLSMAERSHGFHQSLARALAEQARSLAKITGCTRIGLCGGVFQNRVLTDLCVSLLQLLGFTVAIAERLPSNDAGIATGQILHYSENALM
ncbi:carbamoyltransferase HypF [Thioflexithrix psekupsensis]|uniref:Carbamoyltransferase HypF n=1 Tax=Thioflexithrix psekupsensis TaxID=1570016 RepID=A0A251X5G2_9GAMM|nr:carbamoyltransferase HypF [Thioflexithrix psekupsensis]OUD12348.1 carbamoyltransferase HypF [Thioflexithrix psekupsensis]